MVSGEDPAQASGWGISHNARTHRLAIAGFHEEALDIPRALIVVCGLCNPHRPQPSENRNGRSRTSEVEKPSSGKHSHHCLPNCVKRSSLSSIPDVINVTPFNHDV